VRLKRLAARTWSKNYQSTPKGAENHRKRNAKYKRGKRKKRREMIAAIRGGGKPHDISAKKGVTQAPSGTSSPGAGSVGSSPGANSTTGFASSGGEESSDDEPPDEPTRGARAIASAPTTIIVEQEATQETAPPTARDAAAAAFQIEDPTPARTAIDARASARVEIAGTSTPVAITKHTVAEATRSVSNVRKKAAPRAPRAIRRRERWYTPQFERQRDGEWRGRCAHCGRVAKLLHPPRDDKDK
jgi:hypothetical protein